MKRHLFFSLALMVLPVLSLQAQHQTVLFEYEKSYFEQNQPLPAEQLILITGAASKNVDFVEVRVFKAEGKEEREPLAVALWKRPQDNTAESFYIPLNYPLRGSSEYDFLFSYYRQATPVEVENLQNTLYGYIDNYLRDALVIGRKRIELVGSPNKIVSDLDAITTTGLKLYRNKIRYNFSGFSEIVETRLKQIEKVNLKKGRALSDSGTAQSVSLYRQQVVSDLIELVHSEVDQFLNTELYVVFDTRYVNNYPTENTRNEVALNVGYGGAYFDGDFENLDYDHAPYLGISIPLGNLKLSSPFWSHSSVSAGVFLSNFNDEAGNTITGPIIQRPVYVGLGYRFFKFARLNAGITLLEEKQNGSSFFDASSIQIRPFVGLSAEFLFWMKLAE